MKTKTIAIAACLAIGIALLAGNAIAAGNGPAPNSGDCIPDGSGFETTNGLNGNSDSGNGQYGPAPNSGDCIPDGSGFESPNGPNGEVIQKMDIMDQHPTQVIVLQMVLVGNSV